ncbi:MAG: class I SAM-dependent methyltransferase [Candidatus Schekmanbacteria bacterium]|nr:class I SAM-dependent methyltransferase [Candidatus Schekmanbacteria bacterium]
MPIDPKYNDLSYSVRRYYIDEFYSRHIMDFPKASKILDIGGKKAKKRGQFDIEKYCLKVEYVNLDEKTAPDYLCDAEHIPVEDDVFDGVVCSELMEHVLNPKAVLAEAYRVLKPGGTLLLSSPFLFRIHADPYDYARYTDFFYQTALEDLGFRKVCIEKHGGFFSVLADMLKHGAKEVQREGKIQNALKRKLFYLVVFWLTRKAFEWEKRDYFRQNNLFSSFTTGFGVSAVK